LSTYDGHMTRHTHTHLLSSSKVTPCLINSAARQHSVKSKKKELRVFQRNITKKVNKIKEERLEEYQTSGMTRQLIAETYNNLELTAKAHTYEDWCSECNCFHLDKLDDDGQATSSSSHSSSSHSSSSSSSSSNRESISSTPPNRDQPEEN